MKIRPLNVGVESISHWQVEHETHLPGSGPLSPAFLPVYRPLDEILRRPSLEERLPKLLQPELLDPDLLQPSVLTETRLDVGFVFSRAAERHTGRRKDILAAAGRMLEDDATLDEDVRGALAMLLRG
jgi:hypothetical protein